MFGDAIRAIYVAIRLNDREFYERLQRVNQATDEAVKRFKKMNKALEEIGMYSFGAGIAMSAGLGFAVKSAGDFEQALVNLQKVMPEDTDFNRIAEAAKSMAKAYGRSATDVLAAMELWARQGKKQEEVIKLTNAAMQWAIAENLDVAEATEYLTYIINQFNMSAEDSTHIIDALNEVSNNFATDSRKLAQSLSDAGASAKALGVSFDELIGYATALHAAGYQAGEVGTFLSYMFSRLYSKEAVKAFRDAGIEVMDTNGKFRAASEIIAELAKKWDTLTDKQRAMIADSITVGGRVTMIRALMQNYGMAVDATNTALHSHGSAAREVQRALRTFNVELGKTWESVKEVGITIGASLIPVIRPFLKIIQGLANAFNSLPEPIKNAIGLGIGLVAVILTLGGATLLARAAIFRITESLFAMIGAEMGAMSATAALRASLISLMILARRDVLAMRGFATAAWTSLAPFLPLIAAVVAAVLLLQHAWVHNWGGIREATAKVVEGIKWAFGGLIDIIKTFISGFIEPFRFLFSPILEALGLFNKEAGKSSILVDIVNAISGAFRWLYDILKPHIPLIKQIIKIAGALAALFVLLTNPIGQVILLISGVSIAMKAMIPWVQRAVDSFRGFIAWIQQALDRLGPLKYMLLGPAGAILLIAQNFDKLRTIASSAFTSLRTIWDRTIGWIIAKISEFISAIQNAWKAITENPIFKALQTILSFTPAGMGLKVATTAITEHRIPSLGEILPAPSQMISTVQTIHSPRIEHKQIHAPISISIQGVKDPDKVAELVEKRLQRQFNAMGVY